MTVIVTTMANPIVGKTSIAEARMRTAAEVFERHGGKCRVTRVLFGGMLGGIGMQCATADFSTAMSVMSDGMSDPAFEAMMAEREADPGAEMAGRMIFRTVYGDIAWDTHPVSMARIYRIARKNIPAAVAIIEEVDGLSDEINVVGVLPVVNEDMGILHATYQFKSLKDWGEKIDEIGMSDSFQTIVTKANELGTLESSMAYMSI